jgi:hypothetical protein
MYKLLKNVLGETSSVLRTNDNACIPFDPMNSDYIEYLKWVAEGNEPLPPDSQE